MSVAAFTLTVSWSRNSGEAAKENKTLPVARISIPKNGRILSTVLFIVRFLPLSYAVCSYLTIGRKYAFSFFDQSNCLKPVPGASLLEYPCYMHFDGREGNAQSIGDFMVGSSFGEKPEYLCFPPGKRIRIQSNSNPSFL